MPRQAKMKGYRDGGFVSGDLYAARPGPDDVAGHGQIDPFTPDVRQLLARQAANQGSAPAPQPRPLRTRSHHRPCPKMPCGH